MMHEFKFGDIVRHKQTGAVFVVSDLEEDDGFIAAMGKDDAIVYSIDKTQLELIPHPDTRRIDWLESHIMEGGYLLIEFDGSFFLNSTEPMDEFNNYPELRTIMDEIIKETEGDKCK